MTVTKTKITRWINLNTDMLVETFEIILDKNYSREEFTKNFIIDVFNKKDIYIKRIIDERTHRNRKDVKWGMYYCKANEKKDLKRAFNSSCFLMTTFTNYGSISFFELLQKKTNKLLTELKYELIKLAPADFDEEYFKNRLDKHEALNQRICDEVVMLEFQDWNNLKKYVELESEGE